MFSRLLTSVLLFSTIRNALAVNPAPVGLGTATPYRVLAGTTVTNTGPSVVGGDVGVSPGTAVVGFPPGTVLGTIHAADANALQAKSDLVIAYNDAAGRAPTALLAADLGGQTLVSGVYQATSTLGITGTVTLDAQGNPDSVWIFQIPSSFALITASSSRVVLINGGQPCNVFWQVSSSATLGTGSTFVGTIMALTSISATTDVVIQGRLLARNGQVSLDSNTITLPTCTTTTTSSSTTSSTTTSTTTATLPIITLPIGPIGPITVPILSGGIGNGHGGGNAIGNGNGGGNTIGNGNGNGIPNGVLDTISGKGNGNSEGDMFSPSWKPNSLDEHGHQGGYGQDHYGSYKDQYENQQGTMSTTVITKPIAPSKTCSTTPAIEEYDEFSWPTAFLWTP